MFALEIWLVVRRRCWKIECIEGQVGSTMCTETGLKALLNYNTDLKPNLPQSGQVQFLLASLHNTNQRARLTHHHLQGCFFLFI